MQYWLPMNTCDYNPFTIYHSLFYFSIFSLFLIVRLVLHINSDLRQPLETRKTDTIALLTALQVSADSHRLQSEYSYRENILLIEDNLTPTNQSQARVLSRFFFLSIPSSLPTFVRVSTLTMGMWQMSTYSGLWFAQEFEQKDWDEFFSLH